MVDFTKELKHNREIRNLTQTALATATGISQQKISYYENESHTPPIDICIKLADFYGISLDELVGRNFK